VSCRYCSYAKATNYLYNFVLIPNRMPLTNPQMQSLTQEVLAGLVERVTYSNVENGFCVLRAKARGHCALKRLTQG
jgi:hypothetical protein